MIGIARPLMIALTLSVILHLTVLVPVLAVVLSPADASGALVAQLEPEELRDSQRQPPPDEARLGIEAGTPSTFTWIGYDEYERHLAALAEVEQAAFADEVPAAAPLSPDVAARVDLPPPEEDAQAQPPDRSEAFSLESMLESIGLVTQATESAPPPRRHRPVKHPTPASTIPSDQRPQQVEEPSPEPEEKERTEPTPVEPPSEPQAGDQADKETDPTSVIDVPRDQWQLGQPLAAQGLELKPQRPSFTILTILTAAPGNPLCRIEFDRDGIPARAQILESSGDRRVDHAILASLYRWRAEGKPLQELEDRQTLPVTIRILLTRR